MKMKIFYENKIINRR